MSVQAYWDDGPGRNIDHIARHGLTPEEVEEVLLDDTIPTAVTRKTKRPCKFGHTSTGKHIIVVWSDVQGYPGLIYPVTAYEVPMRQKS